MTPTQDALVVLTAVRCQDCGRDLVRSTEDDTPDSPTLLTIPAVCTADNVRLIAEAQHCGHCGGSLLLATEPLPYSIPFVGDASV